MHGSYLQTFWTHPLYETLQEPFGGINPHSHLLFVLNTDRNIQSNTHSASPMPLHTINSLHYPFPVIPVVPFPNKHLSPVFFFLIYFAGGQTCQCGRKLYQVFLQFGDQLGEDLVMVGLESLKFGKTGNEEAFGQRKSP